MKKITKALMMLSIGTLMSSGAQAASSGNLSVIGTIKPATCITSIGGKPDATFDYGKISPTRLLQGTMTSLEVKSLPLLIVCDGATKLAVTAVDNKKGSNPFTTGTVDASDAGEATSQSAASLFGLGVYGEAGDKKIGAFTLALDAKTAKIDGSPAYLAVSNNSGTSWSTTTFGQLGGESGAWRTWTAANGGKDPAQATTFSADLMVKPFIQPRNSLDLNGIIQLSGSATIEIKYL